MSLLGIQTHLTLVELAGVDPGLGVGELLHEDGVRDDWRVNAEGDDAREVGRGDRVVARPEAFAGNRLVSRFWSSSLLDQVLWVFASPSRKDLSLIIFNLKINQNYMCGKCLLFHEYTSIRVHLTFVLKIYVYQIKSSMLYCEIEGPESKKNYGETEEKY